MNCARFSPIEAVVDVLMGSASTEVLREIKGVLYDLNDDLDPIIDGCRDVLRKEGQ